MNSNPSLWLASKSPRRRELLSQIGVRYEVLSVAVEEQRKPQEPPHTYVQRLAQSKAQAGAALKPGAAVLGADTIVVLGDEVLEKPRNQTHAVAMLQTLAGTTHKVMTAVCLCCDSVVQTLCNTTEVTFREISPQEAQAYWCTGEPVDKAGGYGIQGFGGVFVTQIQGSYSSVVGLPLYETSQLLAQFGVPLWSAAETNDTL